MEIKKLRKDDFYWEDIAHLPRLINGKWIDVDFIQAKYSFPNGYGASIICQPGSYGYEDGLLELAVTISVDGDKYNTEIAYGTPIATDVIGFLTANDVHVILDKIKELKED